MGMLENASEKAVETSVNATPSCPPGCVEKDLSMRDRNLIVGACVSYCAQEGKRKVKEQINLERIKRLLRFDETVDYFAMINDAIDDAKLIWEGSRKRYRAWLAVREGVLKASDVHKEYPNMDLESEPQKPSHNAPRVKPEELAGPTNKFYIPAKLYVWITEAVRDMEWPTEKTDMTEGAAELARKLDLAEAE